MRAIVTADIHVHAKRLKLYDKLMWDLINLAQIHRCPYIIMAGDLWDEKHTVNAAVYNMIYRNLEQSLAHGVRWILLRGNHEIPQKSDPHNTMLSVYRSVATVINRPTILNTKRGDIIAFAPWYLCDDFIRSTRKLARLVRHRQERGDCYAVLFGHIGLDEGQLSATNFYRVPQRVCLKHLVPSAYHMVCLGDYHLRQWITDSVLYLGTPIPQGFGDSPTQGVWLFEMEGGCSLSELSLGQTYPQFHTRVITSPLDLQGVDWKRDHHKIRVSADLRDYVEALGRQPNVIIEELRERDREVTAGRLEGKGFVSAEEALRQWGKIKKLNKQQIDAGLNYIRKAKELTYGKS